MRGARALQRAVEGTVDPRVDVDALAQRIAVTDVTTMVATCVNNRVSGLVHDRLAAAGVDPAELAPVAHERDHARFRHLRTVRALQEVTGALDLPFLVVKGPVLASHWYRSDGVRGYGDLDLLVRRHDFADAVVALEDLGYEVITRNWLHYTEAGMAEVQFVRDEVRVDLHWDLQPVRSIRQEIPQDPDGWFERAITVDVAGVAVRTLDAVDTLVHVALHGALSGGNFLVYLTDIAAVAAHDVDYPTLIARVDQIGGPGCVHGILERARRTIGAPIPQSAIGALSRPRLWAPVFGMVDRLARTQRRVEYSLRPRPLLMAGRSSWKATIAALTSITGDQLSMRMRAGSAPRYGVGGSRHYLTPAGGPDAQQAYFDYVASSQP